MVQMSSLLVDKQERARKAEARAKARTEMGKISNKPNVKTFPSPRLLGNSILRKKFFANAPFHIFRKCIGERNVTVLSLEFLKANLPITSTEEGIIKFFNVWFSKALSLISSVQMSDENFG